MESVGIASVELNLQHRHDAKSRMTDPTLELLERFYTLKTAAGVFDHTNLGRLGS